VQAAPQRTLQFLAVRPVLVAALVVAIAGDYLLRGDGLGVAAGIWVALGVVAASLATPEASRRERVLELVPALVFASGLALRDSETVQAWNVFGVLLWLVVPVLRHSGVRLTAARIGDFAVAAVRAALAAAGGPLALTAAPEPRPAPTGPARRARPLIIGAALALVLLIVFGSLLRSADPAFDRFTRLLWQWDLDTALSHIAVISFLAWVATGYLSSLRRPVAPFTLPRLFTLGRLEVALPLGALALLFLLFDIVQLRYVIEGAALVRETLGLTFAEHARRGFFELVAASGLVLAVLLAAGWAVDEADAVATRAYRRLSALVLLAAAPIPVSAFWRLGLYVQAYGLSEDRFFASAVMVWIVWCLVWLAIGVLRDGGRRFAAGAWVAGFVTLLLVNAADPEALIARVNLDRARQGAELDAKYLARLSADAAPILIASGAGLDAETRCRLIARWTSGAGDWRTWNLGRSRARKAARVAAAAGCDGQGGPPSGGATAPSEPDGR
jgi:hypothetical protein